MKSRLLGILSLLVLVLALTACDGSSGSSSSSSSASGVVASAPLMDAEVWGYDSNGVAIQIGKTTTDGSIVFGPGLSNVKFPNAVVFSKNGKNFAGNSTANFAGTLKGVMASSSSAVYLTPANTLVAALVEQGLPLEDAKNRVKKAVTVEMGVNIDPFANPLDQLTESEIVSQTIFAVLGMREAEAGNLDECMEVIATAMSDNGATFGSAAKSISSCPLNDSAHSGMSMSALVKELSNTVIMPQVKEVLSSADGSDSRYDSSIITEQEKEIAESVEPNVPVAIVAAAGTSVPEFYAVTGKVENFAFTFKTLSNKVASDGTPISFAADSPEGNIELANFSGVGEVEETADNVFTYTLNPAEYDEADLPLDITVTLVSDVDSTVTKTINITLVSKTAIVVEDLDFDGKGLYSFDNPASGKIVDGSSHPLIDDEFIADIQMINDFADLNDNVDVRFFAPTGFKFQHIVDAELANTDSYLIKTITHATDGSFDHVAKILTADAVKLVAVLDADDAIEPGLKNIGMQVVDEETGAVLKTATTQLIFLPEGMEKHITGTTLGTDTVIYDNDDTGLVRKVTALDADGNFKPSKMVLKGSIKTWEKVAETGSAPTQDDIRAKGKVILASASGENVFVTAGGLVNELDITNEFTTAGYDFTADVATKFVYKYSNANDDIMMVYIPNNAEDGDTITSSSVLKLQFDDITTP